MKRIKTLSAPVVIAVIGALTLGVSGTAVAGHLITSADIKNHTITLKDISKSTVKKLHGARGPRGPRGPQGLPGTAWYGGHADSLNESSGDAWAAPTGYSVVESSSTNFVDEIGPQRATTLVSISVHLQNAPGVGSARKFAIVANDSPSPQCVIANESTDCTVSMSFPIPGGALIYLQSTVAGPGANGADAAFAWETKG